MNNIFRAWKATFVRRWHSNYDLCHTVDPVSGHQCRVAQLMVLLKPDVSRDAIIYALRHDNGEARYGDMPHDTKKALPDVAAEMAQLEEQECDDWQGFPAKALTFDEDDLVKLCDWLDSYLWMLKHAPHLRHRADWRHQRNSMDLMATSLGLLDKVDDLIIAATAHL